MNRIGRISFQHIKQLAACWQHVVLHDDGTG
jgi:hypothetical protein